MIVKEESARALYGVQNYKYLVRLKLEKDLCVKNQNETFM